MIQKPVRGIQLNRTHPLAKGLVGCWLFNEATGETVFDLSGHSNNGTLENGVAWGNDGLKFDGTDDYVDCGSNSNLDCIDGITIVADVLTNDITNTPQSIFSKNTAADISGYGLYIWDGNIHGWLHDSSWKPVTGSAISQDTRYQFILTHDGANAQLYLDGLPSGSPAAVGTLTSITPFYCQIAGQIGHSSVRELNGFIYSVRIYNRALSADEIAWLYRKPYAMFRRPID